MSFEHDPLLNSNISNDEIRRRLTNEFRIDCGPVTASTRRVLLKKLAKLEGERNHVSGVAGDNHHGESFLSDNSINQVNESLIINGKHGVTSEPVENDSPSHERIDETNRSKKNSPRRYSPRRKTAEEIEAIKSFNEINQQMKKKQFVNQESSETKKTINLRNSSVKAVNVSDLSSKLNQYSSSSESDDDTSIENTPPPLPQISFLNPRIAAPRIFNGENIKTPLSRPPIRRTIVDNKSSPLLNYSDSESEVEEGRNDKLCKMLLSHRPGLGRSAPRAKPSYYQKVSSFFSKFIRKLTPTQTDYSSINFSASSNYISFALLIFVIFFFVVIFSVYFYAKFTLNAKHTLDLNDYTFIEDKNKLVVPICNSEHQENCLPFESDRKPALNIVKEIKGYVDKSIYDYHCKANNPLRDITSFVYSKGELVKELEGKFDHFRENRDPSLVNISSINLLSRDFNNAIKLLKMNPSWNLGSKEMDFEDIIFPFSDYTVQLPLSCNLSLFWQSNMWYIIITVLALGFPFLVYLYLRKSQRAATEEQNLVYELIEKSIELLQSPDEPQSMPVLHIRDTLLTPSERKSSKYRKVWSKVVNHIENAESRVKVEYKKIDGEDFKAWKWIANNSGANYLLNDNEIDFDGSLVAVPQTQKIGGVEWQGQAFGNLLANKNSQPKADSSELNESLNEVVPASSDVYRNKNFQALTRYLKIRNIFEKEAHFLDPNWTKKIKNTILEKTASASPIGVHDIVHIELEDNPSEGLVYLKCASITGATNAFHALHGWWCEKKLVSVKFLKEDRYYQRFPLAKQASTPLKIELID